MSEDRGPKIQTISVSEKHVKARIAAFILAFIVALAAFVNGFLSIGNTKEGYYDLIAEKDADAPYYAAGITYTCLFEGSRGEVRSAVREADAAYSRALSWAYKLCDAEKEYDGYINLATINRVMREQAEEKISRMLSSQAPLSSDFSGKDSSSGEKSLQDGVVLSADGERVSFELAEELYSALRYAYRYTGLGAGYDLFAGPVYSEWKDIIYSEDPQLYDPLNDPSMAERLEMLASLSADFSQFNLSFNDEDHSVSVKIPTAVYISLDALESDAPLIDFGALHDAFMIEMLLSRLDMSGPFGKGVVKTNDGLELDLRTNSVYLALDRRTGENAAGEGAYRLIKRTDGGEWELSGVHASSYEIASSAGSGTLRRDLFFDEYSGSPGSYVSEYYALYEKETRIDTESHELAFMLFKMLSAASAADGESVDSRQQALRSLAPKSASSSHIVMEYAQ